jgi:ABC-2 type transport system ATP-binding protein
VLGIDPRRSGTAWRQRIGVMLQSSSLYPVLTVRESLRVFAGYYAKPRDPEEVIGIIGLAEKADARVRTLSGGQQRRLDLGLGIIGNPELLILDEPTTGFDPSARRGAWDLVRSMTGGGTTVILTTHYMDEAQALADRVAVINAGRIVAEGTPDSLGGRDVGEATIRFRLPPAVAVTDLPVPATVSETGALEIKTDKEIEALALLTNWALGEDVEVIGLTVERLTLEDVYLRLTGHTADVEAASAGAGS